MSALASGAAAISGDESFASFVSVIIITSSNTTLLLLSLRPAHAFASLLDLRKVVSRSRLRASSLHSKT
jgi:hypothetical protein